MALPPDQPTRVRPASEPAPPPSRTGELDLKTLVITAAASALAALVCSKVWAPGTLASAAFTPVAVAIFREALRKPTTVVTTALPIVRRAGGSDDPYLATRVPIADDDPTRVHRALTVADEDATRVHRVVTGADGPNAPTRVASAVGTGGPAADGGARGVVGAGAHLARRWRVAIATGLLGFVLATLLITVPEVLAGKDRTTIFRSAGSSTPTRTETVPTSTTTVIQQVTTVPVETVTTTTETVPTTTTTETQTVTEVVPPTTTEAEVPPATTTTTTTPDEGSGTLAP